MKKIIEKTVEDLTMTRALRGYWYHGEIKLDQSNEYERVSIDSYMYDGYNRDRYFVITYEKGETLKNELIPELEFEQSYVNGYRNSEQGIRYMHAMLDCFDINTLQFDKDRAKKIKEQFEEESNNIGMVQHGPNVNRKVATVEMNSEEENEL